MTRALLVGMFTLGGCFDAPDKLGRGAFDGDAADSDVADGADGDAVDSDDGADGDAVDGDAADGDGADGDALDSDDGADGDALDTDECGEDVGPGCLPSSRALTLFEPAHSGDAMGAPSSLVRMHHPGGVSTWARAAEPIEVALVNGRLGDASLDGVFHFDETLDDAVDGLTIDIKPPAGGERWADGPTGLGRALELGPRYGTGIADIGQRSFTIMGWFWVDPEKKASAAYDLFGFEPGPDQAANLALGVAGGAWQMRLGEIVASWGAVAGDWQHVALTFDRATNAIVFYLDGTPTAVETRTLDLATATSFFIGAKFPQSGGEALGMPPRGDDLVIAARAFDADEVRAHAQSHLPFGTALVDAQADWDDLRVEVGPGFVQRDIIGRRPHADSGPEVEHVLALYRFDGGSFAPAWAREGFGANDTGEGALGVASEVGAFDDPGGAIRATSPGRIGLGVGRPAWGDAFTLALWLKVDPSETTACVGDDDGAALAVAQGGSQTGTGQGFVLRLCGGRLDFTTSTSSLRGTTDLADGDWHLVMAGWGGGSHTLSVDGFTEASTLAGTPADQQLAVSLLHRPPAAPDGPPPALTKATLDELVLYDQVVPPQAALARLWPRLPHARFLAATGPSNGGAFPLPPTTLRAGNQAVSAPTYPCATLVSACAGVIAWWRFDALVGGRALDVGDGGRHLLADAGARLVAGLDGFAVALDGASFRVDDAALSLAQWTIEIAVAPDDVTTDQVIVERPGAGTPPDVGLNYALRVFDGGLSHVFRGAGGADQVARGDIVASVWSAITASYGSSPATLAVTIGDARTAVSPTAGPSVGAGPLPLFVGRSGRDEQSARFVGAIDSLRVLDHALTPAETSKYPRLSWTTP